MLTIIDDFSRRVWSFFLKHKNDVLAICNEWKTMIKKQTRKQINRLCTNNGWKFYSNEFNAFCKSKGIVKHHTVVVTPQQNEVVERVNKTIMEKVCCMFFNFKLSKSGLKYACFLINRSPLITINTKTLIESCSSTPTILILKIFCCLVYARVDNEKLDPI